MSALSYAADTWIKRDIDTVRLKAFEIKCFRRILNVR